MKLKNGQYRNVQEGVLLHPFLWK